MCLWSLCKDFSPIFQEGQTAAELARQAGYDYIAKYIDGFAPSTNGKLESNSTHSWFIQTFSFCDFSVIVSC